MPYSCQETFDRMQDYLDRELTAEEVRLVREHLDGCGICAEEYVFEASILSRVRECLTTSEVPPDLFARITQNLDRA